MTRWNLRVLLNCFNAWTSLTASTLWQWLPLAHHDSLIGCSREKSPLTTWRKASALLGDPLYWHRCPCSGTLVPWDLAAPAWTCTEPCLWASLAVVADAVSCVGSVERGISTCAFTSKTCYSLTTTTVADEDVDEAVFGPLLGGKWLVRMDPSCIVWLFGIFLMPESALAMTALQSQYQFISLLNSIYLWCLQCSWIQSSGRITD